MQSDTVYRGIDHDDGIDIDNIEGSGNKAFSHDLESSGSGQGPDDEDTTAEPVVPSS